MKKLYWFITLLAAMTILTDVSAKGTNWMETVNSDEDPFVIYDNNNSAIPYCIPALAQVVNGNGEINIVDATILVNVILRNN